MNVKRTFGTILTILGIIGLIYAAVIFAGGGSNFRTLAVYGILGAIFFIAGIGLVKRTKDET